MGNYQAGWKISFAASGGGTPLTGELTVGPAAAGLKLNGAPYLQNSNEPDASEEPAQLPGFLTSMIQLKRLLAVQNGGFTEQLAMGRTLHLPLRKPVDVLVTREGARTCRWYFSEGSELPVAVDVEYGQAIDEARLILDDWADRGGIVFPGRIGMISGEKEELTWLTVGEVSSK